MKDNFSSIATIIKRFGGISKSGVKFLTHILSVFMSIKGRINFLQLARHSSEYGEQTCRNQFERFVDFAAINAEYIKQNGSGYFMATFDLTYLRKAGKSTAGLGKYCGAARAVINSSKTLLGHRIRFAINRGYFSSYRLSFRCQSNT